MGPEFEAQGAAGQDAPGTVGARCAPGPGWPLYLYILIRPHFSCCQPTSPPSPLLQRLGLPPSLCTLAFSVLVPSHRGGTHPGGSASAGPLPAPQAPPPTCLQPPLPTGSASPALWVPSRSCGGGGGRRGFLGLPAPPPVSCHPSHPRGAAVVGHCSSLLLPSLLASSGPCPFPHLYLHSPPTDSLSPLHPLQIPGPFSLSAPLPLVPSPPQASSPVRLSPHCQASPGTTGPPLSFSSISSSLSLDPHHPPVFRKPVSVRFSVRLSVRLGLSRPGSVSLSLSFSAITISSHTAVQSQAVPPLPPSHPSLRLFLLLNGEGTSPPSSSAPLPGAQRPPPPPLIKGSVI